MDKDYLYQVLFHNNQSIMLLIDPESGNIVDANQSAIDYYGYSREEFQNMEIQDINVLYIEEIKEQMNTLYGENKVNFQFIHKLANNEEREVEVSILPVEFNNKKLLFSTIHDITDKVSSKLMLNSFFSNSPYAVVILNKDQKIVNINNNFTNLFKYNLEELKGHSIQNFISMDNGLHILDKNLLLAYQGKIVNQEGVRKSKDGQLVDVEILVYPIINNGKIVNVCITYIDISQKKEFERQLHAHVQKDSLTQLYNRNYFLNIIDEYIESSQKEFSIIFIDLDRFKIINDSIGHAVGDKLLIQLSQRLLDLIDNNYVLSRFSGDEFAILCKTLKEENEIREFANLVLHNIKAPFYFSNNMIHIAANIGISRYPDDGNYGELLVRNSDIAMSYAKDTEDKICFYVNEMSKEIESNFLITNYLASAIDNNEFTINYQPIFDIELKRILGAEALLRWNNPVLGGIPPDKFIPLAEKTGLIIHIGKWVIEEICKQIKLWASKGTYISPISINISVKQFEQNNFSQMLIDILEENNISSNSIELEITESIATGEINIIFENIKILKMYGIKISMDDFGTGFSSLGQLDSFELDKLKIDKIFIDDLVNTTKRQNLVKSIIAMANSLDLTVVAEGIETQDQ
ncbi:MAG: EAL domain-containing protein [Tissierella sp.]|nr:EAL domain-containing protein [Tissierella sp.]